jgi:uncharacterized membrane protein
MKKFSWIPLIASALAVAAAACAFKIEKDSAQNFAPQTDGRTGVTGHVLGYDSLRAKIFQPDCIHCHGSKGNVNLETYANAKAVAEKIEDAVITHQSMPPKGPLAPSDQELIREWCAVGSPEQDVDVPVPAAPTSNPKPQPSPEPSTEPSSEPSAAPSPSASPIAPSNPTFATVNARIFSTQCLKCHDANGVKPPKAGVALNTYADVISNLDDIQEEALIEESMPPSGPLSADDEALLKAWISAGTPQ